MYPWISLESDRCHLNWTAPLLPGWAWVLGTWGEGDGRLGPWCQVSSLSRSPRSYSVHPTWHLLLEASAEPCVGHGSQGKLKNSSPYPSGNHSGICMYDKFPWGILTQVVFGPTSGNAALGNAFWIHLFFHSFYSFIHSQVFIDCTRYCFRHRRRSSDQSRQKSCPHGAYISPSLGDKQVSKEIHMRHSVRWWRGEGCRGKGRGARVLLYKGWSGLLEEMSPEARPGGSKTVL